MKRPRKYFVAKHDLASFLAWRGVIWRTGEAKFPRGLKKIQVGDRWVAFAYIKDEDKRDKTQQVVGFYECVSVPDEREEIPPKPRSLSANNKFAWAIKGKAIGRPLPYPVTVASINKLLRRKKLFSQQTLTPIHKGEFDRLRQEIRRLQLAPERIPLLNRDPRCEQEVVAILIAARKELGIERIDRVRTRFPDLRVKLAGKGGLVHLEVETYSSSFLLHGHQHQVRGRILRTDDKSEKLQVAVVCWNHDDDGGGVAACVHKVYELRELLQRKERIRWGR
jgi:hypothetical protein